MTKNYDVIIIGAGLGGLSIGALLAKQGKQVLVCEKKDVLGGRASSDERRGYHLDYGWHVNRSGKEGTAAAVLRKVGKPVEWLEQDREESFIHCEGDLYPLPTSWTDFLTLKMLSLSERLSLLRLLWSITRTDHSLWYDMTWADFVQQSVSSPNVLKFCKLFNFFISAPNMERASAGEVICFIQQARKAEQKVGRPRGGSAQIIEKLEECIEEEQGEILLKTEATKILLEDNKIKGVRFGKKKTFYAPTVVYTPPINQLFDIIDEEFFSSELTDFAHSLEPTATLCLNYGLKRPVSDMAGFIVSLDKEIMVGTFPSNLNPERAPAGKQLSTFMIYVDPANVGKRAKMETAELRLKEWIRELFPKLPEQVELKRRLIIPVMNGAHLVTRQSFPHRPFVMSADVQGLFFVGDTARAATCAGDIAFATALEAANLIV